MITSHYAWWVLFSIREKKKENLVISDAIIPMWAALSAGGWTLLLKTKLAFAKWLSGLEQNPAHQKVLGLFSSQGAYGRQSINVSLSLPKNQ